MNYISIASILFVLFYMFNNVNVEGLRTRIIGGLPTKPREIKYLVAIYRNGSYICGGGIIGPKYILTAAHCVVNTATNKFKIGKFKIIAGSDNLKVKTPSTIEIDVKKFFVPKIYNSTLWGKQYPKGDIAVLELKNKLNLLNNTNLQKLKLPSRDARLTLNDNVYKKVPAETVGFGRDNITYYIDSHNKQQMRLEASRKLLKAKIQIVDRSICQQSYAGNMWDTIICGRVQNYLDGTHQGICKGDSGSPLVQNGTIVVGVVSGSSKSCNDNKRPGIYTKVASFKKFIRDVKQGVTDNMRVQIL